MKKIILGLILLGSLLFLHPAEARTSVRGYFRSNGTYVSSYYRSSANAYKWDNYSYKSYQPAYNRSYYYPTKSYSYSWYTPDYSYLYK